MIPCSRPHWRTSTRQGQSTEITGDHKTPRSVSIFSSTVLHRGRRLLDLMSFFHSYRFQSPDRPPIIDHKNQSTIASLSIRSSKPMSYHHSFATSLHHTNKPQQPLCCDPIDSQTFVVLRTRWIYKGPYQTPIISPYDLPHHQDFAYCSNTLKDFTPVEWNLHCQGSKPCGLSHCNWLTIVSFWI